MLLVQAHALVGKVHRLRTRIALLYNNPMLLQALWIQLSQEASRENPFLQRQITHLHMKCLLLNLHYSTLRSPHTTSPSTVHLTNLESRT